MQKIINIKVKPAEAFNQLFLKEIIANEAATLSWYAIPVSVFIYYVLASLELIAEEIENPFGTDANDLPLDEISKNIRKSVEMVFDERFEKIKI
jgi:predicted membrane chloride channel (bestrophin family)